MNFFRKNKYRYKTIMLLLQYSYIIFVRFFFEKLICDDMIICKSCKKDNA